MKNFIRYILVMALLAVYFLAVNMANTTNSLINRQTITNSWQDSSILPLPVDPLYYATENEASINVLNSNNFQSVKRNFQELWATPEIDRQSGQAWYSQYSYLIVEFLAKHSKSDTIFPFHNFW